MSTDDERNVARYRWLSMVYDWSVERNPAFARPRARLFELASIQPGDDVLIVGVGTGLDLPHLPAGARAIGIDISSAMLTRAQGRAEVCGCSLRQMSAEALDIDDDTFDVVVMSCVLSIVESPQRVLAEAHRVLRPSGSIWVLGKFCESPPSRARRAASRITTSIGGADLTRSLADSVGATPLRASLHETSLAADIIQLKPS